MENQSSTQRVRVIAPSGYLRELDAFYQGVEIWRARGYEVELSAGFDAGWGYLAGTDEHRYQQLITALTDPDCVGIVCARGGFGGARLLEYWSQHQGEGEIIDLNGAPKFLVGFSDITALLWSPHLPIRGIHGPVLTTLAQEPDWSLQRLWDAIAGKSLPPLSGSGWGGGQVRGLLWPGNLTVATHLLGTPHQPPLTDIILAFEDVAEAPYRLDRMLTQWRMSGKLQQVRGIALGRFSQCDPGRVPSFSVAEVLKERLADLEIPIVADLPFGHDGVNAALPVGVMATLDGDQGFLQV